MPQVHFNFRTHFSTAFCFHRSQKKSHLTSLETRFFAAFSSQSVSIYDHKIHVHACETIHKNISNNTFTQLASLQDEQYFLYCVLQSRLYTSSSPSYSLFESTRKNIIHTRILESFIHSLNPISLRLLVDYNAIHLIDQQIQSKTPKLSTSARSLIEKAITTDSTYSMLTVAANRIQQQELQLNPENNLLINYSELLTRVESALNSRVLSLSNQQFANLLEALGLLFESSSCNEFATEIEANHAKTFRQIKTKLLQYSRTRDLFSNGSDIEFLPQILYAFARLSKFSRSIELSSESLGFFDKILSNYFKHFSSTQLVNAAAAFLMLISPDKSSAAGSFHSKFLDTFYFTLLKPTPFYTKEYLTRKLGIANTSFHDQPLGKLLRTALTRMYLMNVRSMQPPFEKQIAFSFSEKCTLISNLVKNTHFKDSPLISLYLQEIISQIRSSYLLDIISDPAIEANHFDSISQAAHALASISIARGDQFMNDDIHAQELHDLILTFFFRHSNKFMQSVSSMFDLIELAGRTSISDGSNSGNKHQNLCNKLLRIKLTEFLTKESINVQILSSFQIVNNQNEYFSSLMRLFAGVLQNNIDDCLPFFAKVMDNITYLNMQNTLTFLDTSLYNLIQSNSFGKLLFKRFSDEQFRSHFHSNYECHIKLLTAYLTAINKSSTSDRFRVNRLLLSNEVDSLLSNASPADINQSNVELSIDFLLASEVVDSQLEFDTLESVFFRIIADQHAQFAMNVYESIVTKCMQLKNIGKNFDDGSECYPICLIDELSQYNRDKFSQFTPEFKDIIQPFIKQGDNITGIGSLLDKCFETISSTAQAAQQIQQQQQQDNNNLNSDQILKGEEKEVSQQENSQQQQQIK